MLSEHRGGVALITKWKIRKEREWKNSRPIHEHEQQMQELVKALEIAISGIYKV